MAGGQRFKFNGSTIKFLVGWSADSPSGTITAITKANPAVVTETAHGKATGDVVRILGALGMTEVNNRAFVIEKIDANSYRLLDVNSTDYGTYTSGGKSDSALFSTLCELTGYNRQGGTSPEIPATSQCSTAQEFEIGLPDYGTTQIDYNFAPVTSSVQAAIQAAYEAGTEFGARVTLPGSGGFMVQIGFVQQTSESAQVGGLWTGSFTMRNTGPRYDFAAA